ncbi:translation initiation factor 2 [Aspergillus homomorphus CBS 101889]|uniref:Translation initiation factor IF-2, mitochondrial n=1 Tax=Aspergillus homomorphus (strain CBS 101889) TaxID=1450537 RepID=A0A395HP53_ASPHC|nr:initiation factor 2 [Aspergillus homomorphus CBS 101889]RAL09540.1 initiation factor 2 [Aspergillus homomorphus CBS 101889]
MYRRAALELSRREGVDWSCAIVRRNATFTPVLNPVPRRHFRAFPANADSSESSNGFGTGPKFTAPRWGSKATRSIGLSPAEQAVRDAMVAKQQEKLREEQAKQEAIRAKERAEQTRRDAIIAKQKAKEEEEQARRDAIIAKQKAKRKEEQARRDAVIAEQKAKRQEEGAQRLASRAEQEGNRQKELAWRGSLRAAQETGRGTNGSPQDAHASETSSTTAENTLSESSNITGTSSPADTTSSGSRVKFASRWGAKASKTIGLSPAEQALRDALVAKQQAQQSHPETTPSETPTTSSTDAVGSESSDNPGPGSPATATGREHLGESTTRSVAQATRPQGPSAAEQATRDALVAKQQAQSSPANTISESSEGHGTGRKFTAPRWGGKATQSIGLSAAEKAMRDALVAKQQAQRSPANTISESSEGEGMGREFAAPRWGGKATQSTGLSTAEKATRDSMLADEQTQHHHNRHHHHHHHHHHQRVPAQPWRNTRPDLPKPRGVITEFIPLHLRRKDWTCPSCGHACWGRNSACIRCGTIRPELLEEQTNPHLTIKKHANEAGTWSSRSGTRQEALDEYRTRFEEEQRRQGVEREWDDQGPDGEGQPQKSVNDWSWDTSVLRKLEVGEGEKSATYDKWSKRGRKQRLDDDEEFDTEEYKRRRQEKKRLKRDKNREKEVEAAPSPLYLPEFISVSNLADVIGVRHAAFLQRMEEMGFEEVTHSHVLDAETAGLIAAEYNYEPIFDTGEDELTAAPEPEDKSNLPPRPPVVTIMGHVDHGKTTILDWLRKSSIVASEHGGITQHIGAFSVSMPSGKTITFLDTPGHAAFLDMRRRGADVTDIVVLVVAADDSVKPQTIEAIKHATEANVPIIVAMSKMDKEGVNPDKVKQDLSVHGVHVEDYGGDVQAIGVSGKTGAGMLELEEAIVTLSEILDHRADPTGNVEGWVVEGTTKSYGRVATMLIRRGTLRPGDIVVAGTTWARVRTLRNEASASIDQATPGMPVEVDGWREQPEAGTEFLQAKNEQQAKSVVEYRLERAETSKLGVDTVAINEARREMMEKRRQEEAGLESSTEGESGPKPVHFIIKADVHGSAEAVLNSVTAVGNNEVYANVLRAEVGPVSEFDIEHAASANGHVISFNMPIDPRMSQMAEARGVTIKDHNVIYRLIDDVKSTLSEHLPPLVTQRVTGEAEIRQIFEIKLKGRERTYIAGCRVRNGLINRTRKVRVLRGQETIYDGSISSLKNVKKDVTEMRKDTECGIAFEGWTDFQEGDHVQCYEELFEKRYL